MVSGQLTVPAYLPAQARPLLTPLKRHANRVAARYDVPIGDLWDEIITALIRAATYYDDSAGRFAPYAWTAVHRACWRYVVSPKPRPCRNGGQCRTKGCRHSRIRPELVSLEHWHRDADEPARVPLETWQPSPEDWLLAHESLQAFTPPKPERTRRARQA